MLVREIMTQHPKTISPEASIQEAAEHMALLNVGFIPATDRQRMAGVITDRDITVRATAKDYTARTTRVRDVMSADVVCCYEDDDVDTAVRLMEERRVRRLPVLDHGERLVGVVTLGDLAVREEPVDKAHELLREVSEPAGPVRYMKA